MAGAQSSLAEWLLSRAQPTRLILAAVAGVGVPMMAVSSAGWAPPAVRVSVAALLVCTAVFAIWSTEFLSDEGIVNSSTSGRVAALATQGVGAAAVVTIVVAIFLAVLVAIIVMGALLAAAKGSD